MNKILSLVVVSAALFFTSCKKQLDLNPSDSIDASKAFLNVADLDKGVLGVYSANNPINKIYIALSFFGIVEVIYLPGSLKCMQHSLIITAHL